VQPASIYGCPPPCCQTSARFARLMAAAQACARGRSWQSGKGGTVAWPAPGPPRACCLIALRNSPACPFAAAPAPAGLGWRSWQSDSGRITRPSTLEPAGASRLPAPPGLPDLNMSGHARGRGLLARHAVGCGSPGDPGAKGPRACEAQAAPSWWRRREPRRRVCGARSQMWGPGSTDPKCGGPVAA